MKYDKPTQEQINSVNGRIITAFCSLERWTIVRSILQHYKCFYQWGAQNSVRHLSCPELGIEWTEDTRCN